MEGWSRRRFAALAVAATLAAALVVTWPLALHFASAIPLGTETAATVPLFDVWTLWWSATRFGHGYADLWNAPIFHPTAGTFAFSEPLLLPGILAAPLFWAHAPPALAHNFVLIAVLTAGGLFAARLARGLGVARLPALLAGVLMVTLPIFAKLQGELPLLIVAGTLIALDGLVRFGRDGRTRHAITAGAGLVVQMLSGQQVALFATLFVVAAGLVAMGERRFARGALVRLGGVAVATAIIVAWIAATPLAIHHEMGFTRDPTLVQSLSARFGDFFTRPAGAIVPFPPREDATQFTGGLFPGLILLALGALAFARGETSRWRWYGLGVWLAGGLLALGLNLSILGWHPFATLRALVPGFAEVRSAFRSALFAQVALVMLAGLGLGSLARRLRGHPRAPIVVAAIGLLAALENLSLPARLLPVPRSARAPWTAFLASQPPGTVIAHVPFPADSGVEQLAPEAWRMFAQIDHEQPLVNGYSSNFPAVYREFMFAMGAQFPQHALACALRRIFGADLLVVDQDWLTAHREPFAELSPPLLEPVYADDAVAIFRMHPSAEECPPMRIDIGPR